MYISTNLKTKRVPPPTTIDGKYVAEHLGTALTLALAEIADCRPWDPIEYLGQWLYKYRENRNYIEKVNSLFLSCKSDKTFNLDNYCTMTLTTARAIDARDSRGGEADGSCREGTRANQTGAEIHHGGGATGAGEGGGREEAEGEGGATETVCCSLGV